MVSSRIILFSFFFISLVTNAADRKWLDLKNSKVSLEIPSDWIVRKNALQIPLVILSPIKKKGRFTLSVSPLNIPELKLDPKVLKKTKSEYESGRLDWLSGIDGKALKFFPYQKEKWPYTEDVHHLGYRFEIAGITYQENSYYVNCLGQMYVLKSLFREKEYQKDIPTFEKMIKGFKCKRSKPVRPVVSR